MVGARKALNKSRSAASASTDTSGAPSEKRAHSGLNIQDGKGVPRGPHLLRTSGRNGVLPSYACERAAPHGTADARGSKPSPSRNDGHYVAGSTGVGKSFVACALAQKACRDGYSAFYTRAAALFRDLAIARADGSLRNFLAKLSRIDVLVIDDWAMAPMADAERRDFWEICEDRYQTRSTILTSQLPVARWHEQIGDPTAADGILDRLVHNAHRVEMRGDSMRKKRGAQPSS